MGKCLTCPLSCSRGCFAFVDVADHVDLALSFRVIYLNSGSQKVTDALRFHNVPELIIRIIPSRAEQWNLILLCLGTGQ